MYAGFWNQCLHLLQYFMAITLLLVIWPMGLFAKYGGGPLERAASRFLGMMLLLLVLGYMLAALKLFEAISIVMIVGSLTIWSIIGRRSSTERQELFAKWATRFFDYFENKHRLIALLRDSFTVHWKSTLQAIRFRLSDPLTAVEYILLVAVFGLSAYIRFYDAATSPAPAWPDGYTTLVRMKRISESILVADGWAVPQGLYMFMSYLRTFSFIDAVYVLKYTGPFVSMMILLGQYAFIVRLTKSRIAGLAGVAAFGLFSGCFPGDFERHAAADPQQFAYMFLFPVLMFYFRYMESGENPAFRAATCGIAAAALSHTQGYGLVAMSVAVLCIVFMFAGARRYWRKTGPIVLALLAGALISLLPFLLSHVMGASPDSASAFHLGDITALSEAFWALILPVLIGVAWSALFTVFPKSNRFRAAQLMLGLAAVGYGAYWDPPKWDPPKPIQPDKLGWDSAIEQYLRINESFRPKTWHIVTQREGYALALSSGYHMDVGEFLASYDPAMPPLTEYGKSMPDSSISHRVFLYEEKNVFRPDRRNTGWPEGKVERRKQDSEALREWVKRFEREHGSVPVFYEDENLKIYEIYRPESQEEIRKKIWNEAKGEWR